MHRRIAAHRMACGLVACGGFPTGTPFGRCRFFGNRWLFRRVIRRSRIDLDRCLAFRRLCIDLDRTIFAVGLVCTICAFCAVGLLRRADGGASGFGTVRTIGISIAVGRRRTVRAVCVIAITAITASALAALPIPLTLSVIGLGICRLPFVPLFLIDGINAEVMLGMLKVILCSNTIAGGRCVARQSQVFFVYLERVAANPDAWSVAIECLLTICAPTPTISAARALRALALFHISLHIEAGFCFR